MPLTEKQQIWAKSFAEHGNGRRASREAGYAQNSWESIADRMKKHPGVMKQVERHQQAVISADKIDKAWLIVETVETYNAAREAKQNAAAFTGLQLIAKIIGALDGSESQSYHVHLEGLSPDELQRLARLPLASETVPVIEGSFLEVGSGRGI